MPAASGDISPAPESRRAPTLLEHIAVKSAVETVTPTRVKLTVEVPYDELKPSLDAAYQTIAAQIQVPGFRRGKVPARIIDQRVGRGAVVQEAVSEAMPRLYGQAVEQAQVRPLGQPELEITEAPLTAGQELRFTAEVDVRPEFTLPDLGAIEIQVDAVGEQERAALTEERLADLRSRFGTLTGVDRPARSGDLVSVDLSAEIGGEPVDQVTGASYEVGSGQLIEGLDEALEGLAAGQSATFASSLAGGEHAGEAAQVTVTVAAVKERVLPELDDDFAQLASQFDTLEELRADVGAQADRVLRLTQGAQAQSKLLDQLLAAVDIPVPDGVVKAEVDHHLEEEGRLDDEAHRAEVDQETRVALRRQLLLDAVAEQEKVSVGQQELIEFLVYTAQQSGMDPNEYVKAVDENGQVPAVVAEVRRRKALTTLLDRATVTDTDGSPVDLTQPTRPAGDEPVDEPGDEPRG